MFYSHNAFITAAGTFSGFRTTGDAETRRRELAAFLAQTSHETTGKYINNIVNDVDLFIKFYISINVIN